MGLHTFEQRRLHIRLSGLRPSPIRHSPASRDFTFVGTRSADRQPSEAPKSAFLGDFISIFWPRRIVSRVGGQVRFEYVPRALFFPHAFFSSQERQRGPRPIMEGISFFEL